MTGVLHDLVVGVLAGVSLACSLLASAPSDLVPGVTSPEDRLAARDLRWGMATIAGVSFAVLVAVLV